MSSSYRWKANRFIKCLSKSSCPHYRKVQAWGRQHFREGIHAVQADSDRQGHLWVAPPPVAATDINGDCETEFIVPAGMEPDAYALTVYMPYPSEGVFTAYTVAPGELGVKGRARQGLCLRPS